MICFWVVFFYQHLNVITVDVVTGVIPDMVTTKHMNLRSFWIEPLSNDDIRVLTIHRVRRIQLHAVDFCPNRNAIGLQVFGFFLSKKTKYND